LDRLFTIANAVRNTELSYVRPSDNALVPALVIACRILDALARAQYATPTLTELSRELGLPKSTVHNQLSTLQAHGLVHRDEATRGYRLGAHLVSLGLAGARQLRSAALVAQRLPSLASDHHLTFAVAQVADRLEAVLVNCAYPDDDVHVGLTLGSRYGVFHGAVGKCLLAGMDPSEADRIVRRQRIPRHTAQTIVDADAFLADIDQVRRRGWATSAGEFKDNHAVAAPLFNQAGALELVVFVVGFPAQLPADLFEDLGQLLRGMAQQVEAATGATR